MMLEMLANANWERPIYMAITVGSENHLGMGNHFTQEGLAYRFTPFDTDKLDSKIDSEKMYDNLMNKFKFGGIDKPGYLHRRERDAYVLHAPPYLHAARRTAYQRR